MLTLHAKPSCHCANTQYTPEGRPWDSEVLNVLKTEWSWTAINCHIFNWNDLYILHSNGKQFLLHIHILRALNRSVCFSTSIHMQSFQHATIGTNKYGRRQCMLPRSEMQFHAVVGCVSSTSRFRLQVSETTLKRDALVSGICFFRLAFWTCVECNAVLLCPSPRKEEVKSNTNDEKTISHHCGD